MNTVAEDIAEYFRWLRDEKKLEITVQDFDCNYANTLLPPELQMRNIHTNPYCLLVKSCHKMLTEGCVLKKSAVLEKCKREREPFFGMCYAGCEEFVYPMEAGGQSIGFVTVGSYRRDYGTALSKIAHISEKYGLDRETYNSFYYRYLSPEIPSFSEMDRLIKPFCRMIELYYLTEFICGSGNPTEHIVKRVIQYIHGNYSRPFALRELADELNYSEWYISRRFHEETGSTIKEYLTKIRLEAALRMLENTDLSVTTVTYMVGFQDSNYFSFVFKKAYGITPTAYRKRRNGEK